MRAPRTPAEQQRRHRKNAQHLETFGGLLLFGAVVVLALTVHAELTGRPALGLVGALVLLLACSAVVVTAARAERKRSR